MESLLFLVFTIAILVGIPIIIARWRKDARYLKYGALDDMKALGIETVDKTEASSTIKDVADDPDGWSKMSLYTEKVVGVTRKNKDGVSRQHVIKYLDEGDPVQLIREPNNSHDPDAIGVWDKSDQIGYIEAGRASELAPQMDKGYRVDAWVKRILGGYEGKSYGVVIAIQRYKPKAATKK